MKLRLSFASVLAAVCLVTVHTGALSAAEKLSEEQVAALVPRLFEMHLKQHSMDHAFMRRVLREYAGQLDPMKSFFLKNEVDTLVNIPEEDLSRLERHVLEGDLSYFRALLAGFLDKQVTRDEALYAALENHTAEIKRTPPAPQTPPTPTTQPATPEVKAPVKSAAEQSDDDDKFDWQDYAETPADRENRLVKRVRNAFELDRAYLSESEAMTLALQTVRRDRQKWLELSKSERDVEVPKLFLKSFMNAMDPHTDYFDDDEEEFTGRLERNFAGIGVQIRPCPLGVYIEEIIKGGPSDKSANLFPGDQIVAVDGFTLTGLPMSKCVKRIKGEKGAEVRLTVLRRGVKKTDEVRIRRDTVELASLRVKGKTIEANNNLIGIVSVQTFYRGVHNDVRDRIRELGATRSLDGVVLDLRGNHGGYLDEAIGVAGLFLDHGTVVGERDADNKIDWKDSPDGAFFTGPLVVLTNQFSASASEIVAGALQDHNRALIVAATQTYGKGTVQRVVQLSTYNTPGEIKITTHQYFLPGGASVQMKGVPPDVVIPGVKLDKDSLESGNENALPWAKIESRIKSRGDAKLRAEWKARNLADLQARSKVRVDANPLWKDAYDLKKKHAAEVAKFPQNPEDAPPPLDPEKDDNDLQIGEAAAITGDMVRTWYRSGKEAATSDR